ncbi:MAG: TonB-dependent receptor, partial [Pseudomonadota bacterium]
TNFVIRGFGNGANNAGIEPSVGVFVDGVYRSRTAAALFDLPNLERVEVLRGPQSTLFGKNASAGVINIVTATPDLDEFGGSASVTIGDYSQVIVKGDISGPLSDSVGFSLSGSYNQRDGYYDNLAGGDPLGEQNRYSVRGQLYFVPTDAVDIRIIADMSDLDEACCGVANLQNGFTGGLVQAVGGNLVPNAPFAYQGYYDFTPQNELESGGISAQINWDLNDDVTLTSITASRSLSRFENADVDFTSLALADPSAGNLTDYEIDTLTQEFRLSGATDNMSWLVGAYIFDEDVEQRTAFVYGTGFRPYADLLIPALSGGTPGVDPSPLPGLEAALGLPAGTFYAPGQGATELSTMDNSALSIFAQVDVDLGERATLTLGANFTDDEKDITFNTTNTDVFSSLDMVDVGFGLLFSTLTGGQPPTPANFAMFPAQFAQAQALSTVECSPTTGPACNQLLGLQIAQFLPTNVDFPNAVENGNTQDDDVTWTVRLAYDLSDSVNVYASAGTGFKASSWNLSRDSRPTAADIPGLVGAGLLMPNISGGVNLAAGTRFALPEEATVYELGLKGIWDTVAMNVAVFDQQIENFQSNVFNGTGFNLANAGKQSTTGVEIDVRWAPTEAFQGSFSATFLDPTYDSFLGASSVDDLGNSIVADLSGTQPAGIHEVSISASGVYSFEIGNADAFIRAEYIYEDKVRINENTPASVASREVGTLNASFGMAWDNGFEALLWGRNITDDEYLLSSFPSVAQFFSFSGYPNQPSTYGLTLRKYFY